MPCPASRSMESDSPIRKLKARIGPTHGDTPTAGGATATPARPITNVTGSRRALRARPLSAPMSSPAPHNPSSSPRATEPLPNARRHPPSLRDEEVGQGVPGPPLDHQHTLGRHLPPTPARLE